MSQSASASTGWGVDLGEAGSERSYDIDDIGDVLSNLAPVFGWTEPHPGWPDELLDLPYKDRAANPACIAHQAVVDDWNARRNHAIPVTGAWYGHIDYSGHVLVTRRSLRWVNWGCDAIDPGGLVGPEPWEILAIGAVLDHIGFTGERRVALLLWASYG
jgi:hypothetical protein